jgi:hypothetical protein
MSAKSTHSGPRLYILEKLNWIVLAVAYVGQVRVIIANVSQIAARRDGEPDLSTCSSTSVRSRQYRSISMLNYLNNSWFVQLRMIGVTLQCCYTISVYSCFLNWLNGVDDRFKKHVRVAAIVIILSLWLYRNNKVFSNKTSSLLQVIYRCIGTLCLWSL